MAMVLYENLDMSVFALSLIRDSEGGSSGASGIEMWLFNCSAMSPALVREEKLKALCFVRLHHKPL
jgi:hypothetical protein